MGLGAGAGAGAGVGAGAGRVRTSMRPWVRWALYGLLLVRAL